jgi:hypothetical protein
VVVIAAARGIHDVGAVEAEAVGQVRAFRADAPFPGHVGLVSGLRQKGRDRRLIVIPDHGIAGQFALLGRHGFDQRAHARLVIVLARHQHGAARPAEGRGIVAREQRARLRQRVDIGRARVAAIGAEAGEADIVEQHHEDVRTCLLCVGTVVIARIAREQIAFRINALMMILKLRVDVERP